MTGDSDWWWWLRILSSHQLVLVGIAALLTVTTVLVFFFRTSNENPSPPLVRNRRAHSGTLSSGMQSDTEGEQQQQQQSKPLRCVLFCLGTRGDVQPMIAVAKELKRRGHQCCLCAADEFATLIKAHQIEFASCGLPTMRDQEASWISARNQSEFIAAVAKTYIPKYDDMGLALLRACETPIKADVVVTGLYGIQMALDVGDKLQIAVWAMKFMPDTVTALRPPFGTMPWSERFLCSRTLAGLLCKFRHYFRIFQAVSAATTFNFTKRQNEFRKNLGMGPVTLERLNTGGKYLPTIYAFSQVLFSRPNDYPPWHRVAGFFLTPGAGSEEKLSPVLESFLSSSTAAGVICVTFGSMSCLDAAGCDVVRRATHAALSLGFRVVVLSGWSQQSTNDINMTISEQDTSRVLVIESAPHELLFPRCVCIIHHGGAGTTARVAFSGVPSVVVPVLRWLDQAGWANALEDFGVAIHIKTPFCSEDELRAAIKRLCVDWDTAIVHGARSRDLQRRMLNEEAAGEGARRAVRWLLSPLPTDESRSGAKMVKHNDLTLFKKMQ